MSHKQRIVSFRLAALLAVTSGLLLFGMSVSPQSSAQKSRGRKVQRWEYCAILGAQSKWPRENKEKYTGVATICYFHNRAFGAPARATESALSKAITKLGDDGWEMAGENRIDFSSGVEVNNKAIYFKRRTSR